MFIPYPCHDSKPSFHLTFIKQLQECVK